MTTKAAGDILALAINSRGWAEFTIEPIDPELGIPSGSVDLGNGNHAYGFISNMLDEVYCTPGERIDFKSCNLEDWKNLSSYYTGQQGAPDSMHDSEYIGFNLADDLARVPGEYITPYITWYCDIDCECEGEGVLPNGEYCELDTEGWLVMYRDIFDTEIQH